MMDDKFLIYIDILGFDKRAEEIASSKGIESRGVRAEFIRVIDERISLAESSGLILGKNYGESDDWILVFNSIENVFRCIDLILEHHTIFTGYEEVPLEIAVGTGKYDKWARFDGKELIIEDSTIKSLKTHIVNHYHKVYKKRHRRRSPKTTFIVLTESAFERVEPYDKDMCDCIEYQAGKQTVRFYSADVDRVRQRGKIYDFLEKIEHPDSRFYHRIDEVFIPPAEYDDIRSTLEEKRVVFITGPQEYGKTYSAVRLMWEYYSRGYEPKWISGLEKEERIQVRKRLGDIESILRPRRIVYFEDPFGRTKYEESESLEREIGTILDTIKHVNDAFVVITSREEVFKEFEKRKLSAAEIKEFERKLNIKRPSYDNDKRNKILLMWAKEKKCVWRNIDSLRESITSSIQDKRILPTPLSIRDFAISTADIDTIEQLLEIAKEKSEETEKAFAREIEGMTRDKILFLSLLFLGWFHVDFLKNIYKEMIDELGIESSMGFDTILNWFMDDKIEVSYTSIQFSHPSYSETLKYLLTRDGQISEINREVFSPLLLKLSEQREAAFNIAHAVEANFDKLPEDIRNNLLVRLSGGKRVVAFSVARVVVANFGKLPEDIRNNLLVKLSEKGGAVRAVAHEVAAKYKVPEDIRNLLFKLSEKEGVARAVAHEVAKNFDMLPEDIRNNLLVKLSEKKGATRGVASAVTTNFDMLPEDIRNNLLVKLSEEEQTVGAVAYAVLSNFDKLPEDIRNNLLVKLSEKDEAAWGVANAVAENFDKLPKDIRNNLLVKLSKKKEAAGAVARTVAENFDKLPKDIRSTLVLKLRGKVDLNS